MRAVTARVTTASARVASRVPLTRRCYPAGDPLPPRPGRATGDGCAHCATRVVSRVRGAPADHRRPGARGRGAGPDRARSPTSSGARFAAAGEEIALVGGPVRDAMLGRLHNDLDFTTSARPEVTERLLKGWAEAIWDIGREFGTIGCRRGEWQVEITTYRSEAYDPQSRKPAVQYGDSLVGDLARRDFTVNSMALVAARAAARGPVRRRGRPRPPGAAHARAPGGLVLRRPAADDARRPLRRAARLHGRARGGRGDDRHGRADHDRLGRAGPRRAGQAAARARPGAVGCACSWRPVWPTRCCPSCPRWRSSATSTTATRTSTSTP